LSSILVCASGYSETSTKMDQTIRRHYPEDKFSYSPPFRDVKLSSFGSVFL